MLYFYGTSHITLIPINVRPIFYLKLSFSKCARDSQNTQTQILKKFTTQTQT